MQNAPVPPSPIPPTGVGSLARTLWYLCLLQVILAGAVVFLLWERTRPPTVDPVQQWLERGAGSPSEPTPADAVTP